MVSSFIKVERADNARRALAPGYEWQEYAVAALKVVNKTTFQSTYGNMRHNMEHDMYRWEDAVNAYVNERSSQLGMWIGSMYAQLVEEPNESKFMEKLLWESRDAAFVWSVWTKLFGPVPAEAWTEAPMPLFRFWPREVSMNGNIPEIVDAAVLSFKEQEDR
tara:strand:- start:472 stop:957 length:486 start_codon:yes stop_codon:yes gene_type:complete